eukprot:GHVR01034230.1.p1 GENE.GHVR01034230.1~~GHVR01034230.1.p1  ORF type:complete len:313 (-),score=28.32 GHVR01034230.1:214-1152(-)
MKAEHLGKNDLPLRCEPASDPSIVAPNVKPSSIVSPNVKPSSIVAPNVKPVGRVLRPRTGTENISGKPEVPTSVVKNNRRQLRTVQRLCGTGLPVAEGNLREKSSNLERTVQKKQVRPSKVEDLPRQRKPIELEKWPPEVKGRILRGHSSLEKDYTVPCENKHVDAPSKKRKRPTMQDYNPVELEKRPTVVHIFNENSSLEKDSTEPCESERVDAPSKMQLRPRKQNYNPVELEKPRTEVHILEEKSALEKDYTVPCGSEHVDAPSKKQKRPRKQDYNPVELEKRATNARSLNRYTRRVRRQARSDWEAPPL